MCQEIKESIPPSSEKMYHEVRDIKEDITKMRQEQVSAYEKLNSKIKEKNEMRKLNDLEMRMTTR